LSSSCHDSLSLTCTHFLELGAVSWEILLVLKDFRIRNLLPPLIHGCLNLAFNLPLVVIIHESGITKRVLTKTVLVERICRLLQYRGDHFGISALDGKHETGDAGRGEIIGIQFQILSTLREQVESFIVSTKTRIVHCSITKVIFDSKARIFLKNFIELVCRSILRYQVNCCSTSDTRKLCVNVRHWHLYHQFQDGR